MARAIRLARNGLYGTAPNPRVGCVLVRDGQIVGEGWHESAGLHHAEIRALNQAGAAARGAIVYVTLEPCVHTGRTPPCVNALVAAGVSKVIMAMTDPNPRVCGKGVAALDAAGIATGVGLLEGEARSLNPGFIKRMTAGLPWVRCKMAISLDGKIAAADGGARWITGAEARDDAHRLRAQSCAVVTGIGTVLSDDPRLDARIGEAASRQPLRVVLDRRLRCRTTAAMLSLPGRSLIFTRSRAKKAHAALQKAGAEIIVLQTPAESFPESVIRYLAEKEQVNEVLVEAGPRLSGAMLSHGLIDELIIYQAPVLLGDQAPGTFHLPDLRSLSDAMRLELTDMRRIGKDWRLTFLPVGR